MNTAQIEKQGQIVAKAVHRVWGLAHAVRCMSQTHLNNEEDISGFMNSLDEIGQAMKDALSPAIDAADVLSGELDLVEDEA